MIDIDEHDYTASVTVEDETEIGSFEFSQKDDEGFSYLRLTNMHLEGCSGTFRRKGIGREILRLVREVSGMEIEAAYHDGNRLHDGSHLTEDGPAFVHAMRKEGFISP